MKGIVTLAVVLGIIAAVIAVFVMRQSMSDQGTWIYMAMGNPQDKTIDVVMSVELGMTVREPPKLDDRNEPKWDEWVGDHFNLRGPDGKVQPFTREAHTMLVDERKAKHLPEFYIQYVLQKGEGYTLDYVPSPGKKGRYRHTFTAPGEAQEPQRVLFTAVTESP